MYRPLLAGKVTLTELKTTASVEELLKINALLDMEEDIKADQQMRQELEYKRQQR
jgi:predicted NUDIX family phosphoesterase